MPPLRTCSQSPGGLRVRHREFSVGLVRRSFLATRPCLLRHDFSMTSVKIEDLLNRRTDLSTFVVHLTKASDSASAANNLRSILSDLTIRAVRPMGWAVGKAVEEKVDTDSQRVVSFSETPLEHLYAMFADIDDRDVRLEPYGLAFTKATARRKGVNPVWYIDKTWGRRWTLGLALDELRDDAVDAGFPDSPATTLLPFIEPMFDWREHGKTRKEFWWEREWRHLSDFKFDLADIALVIAPDELHDELEKSTRRRCINGGWSLERVMAKLADVKPGEQETAMAGSHTADSERDF